MVNHSARRADDHVRLFCEHNRLCARHCGWKRPSASTCTGPRARGRARSAQDVACMCKHVQNGQACLRHHVDPAYDHRRFQTCSRRPLAASLRVHWARGKAHRSGPPVRCEWLRTNGRAEGFELLGDLHRKLPAQNRFAAACSARVAEARAVGQAARLRRVVA